MPFEFMFRRNERGEFQPALPVLFSTRKVRIADGREYFTLLNVAQLTGRATDDLAKEWEAIFADTVPTEPAARDAWYESFDRTDRQPEPDELEQLKRRADPNRKHDYQPPEDSAAAAAYYLRRVHAGGLTDGEFAEYQAAYTRAGLDPFKGECFPSVQYNADTQRDEVVAGLTIAVMRKRASMTGQLVGINAPQWSGRDGIWVDVWTKDTPPHACRVAVWRLNWAKPVWGLAYWRGACRLVLTRDNKTHQSIHYRVRPEMQLAKCAEADGLRKGFAEVLSHAYTPEELAMMPSRKEADQIRQQDADNPPADEAPDATPGAAIAPESLPDSRRTFELLLVDHGMPDAGRRSALILQLRARIKPPHGSPEEDFWRLATRELLNNPARYGLSVPAPA